MTDQPAAPPGAPRIFIVDDQLYFHALVNKALGEHYTLEPFNNGESALSAAQANPPALILLDVEMPDMDGYETCWRLKSHPATQQIPVIFLSAHDETEDRLKGYEAGGEDYLTKPFDFQELKTKVQLLLEQAVQRAELQSRADSAASAAMTVMTSMSEIGVLLEALRRFNGCLTCADLAREVIAGVGQYDLQSVVYIHLPGETQLSSWNGVVSPLEASVIERLHQQQERLIEFKTRLVVNYEHISLLINNMPLHDPDLVGRLRDHLCMLAEGADVRAGSLLAMRETSLRQALEGAIASVTDTLRELHEEQQRHRLDINSAVLEMREAIEDALVRLGLSDAQEEFMLNTIQRGVESIIQKQTDEVAFERRLASIIQQLQATLNH